MVLSIPPRSSLCRPEPFSPERHLPSTQSAVFRSRAHNIPGGIKHLLSDPKRRRRVSAARFPSLTFSHRGLHRSTPLGHKNAHSATKQTQTVLARASSSPESQPTPPVSINVTFPRHLDELPRKQISNEVLASLGFTSEEVPCQYIRDRMQRISPIMYQALRSTKASVPGPTLPESLVINVDDDKTTPMPPTHMAAVYSSAPSCPTPRRVFLYPIHQSILSLYCANLPVLATSTPPSTVGDAPFEVPVVPLALPNPDSFPLLVQFLYLKDVHTLFGAFLSLTPENGIPTDLDDPARYIAFVGQYATMLSQNYTMQRLASHAVKVHGLWRNACALGISDVDLQAFLDLAWEILMQALTLSSHSAPVVVSAT
ncbi:hypothetical protein F5148DRAFT_1149874 [Russula earlei]|uniref:Uncharacterized protein n=1 Tax=Russula earlei TaxID=71964 RepID=A0ACC0U837_9AGAM|nr:hypothetical protein F5148DRAFT_1149874 [Russula earlei]